MRQVKRIYLIFFISQVLWASSIADFQLTHTAKAGLYQNPPLSFGSLDNPKGIFVDLLNYIGKKNGMDIVYVKCDFSKCLKMLKNGSIDILSPIAKSKDRSKYAYFTDESVISNWGVVYGAKDKIPNSFLDIKNKRVGFLKKDIYTTAFKKLSKNFDLKYKDILYNSYNDIFEAIKKGDIDYGVANRLIYISLKEKYKNISPSTIYFNPIAVTFAVSKQNPKLFKVINNELNSLKADRNSALYLILSKYLGENGAIRSIVSKVLWIIGILAAIILISVMTIWYFKHQLKKKTEHIQKAKFEVEKLYKHSIYLNDLITMAKNINQVLIERLDIEEKLNKICKELVRYDIFNFAWIGFLKDDLTLQPTNSSNTDTINIKKFPPVIFKKNISICKTLIIKDSKEMSDKSIKDISLLHKIDNEVCKYSYHMLVPVKHKRGNHPVAFLAVHTKDKNGFSDKEISLIEELSGDIGMMLNNEYLKQENENLLKEKIEDYKSFIDALVFAIEARDPYTAGHSKRVAKYAKMIAKALFTDDKDVETLTRAAKVHDIGKIAVPDSILLKPGSLNNIEYKIIKNHALIGYEILNNLKFFKKEADIIKHHHERYDGSGYPDGIRGDDIPLLTIILSIADTFDAMTTDRIYKIRKTKDKALEEISKLCGKWFEPAICQKAVEVLEKIDLEESTPQLPTNELDDARFAYFFKDQLTGMYNYKYLDFHVSYFKYFLSPVHNITMIELHNFSKFNEKNGWQEGNELLVTFAEMLREFFEEDKIFRIKGDDFIILHKKKYNNERYDKLKDRFNSLHSLVSLEINTYPATILQDKEKYKQWLYAFS